MRKLALAVCGVLCLSVLGCRRMATAPSTAPDTAQATPTPEARPVTTRQMAWELGNNLSLAALGTARGADARAIGGMLADAQDLAKASGLEIPPFPPQDADETKTTADTIFFLLQGPGAEIGKKLGAKYGDDHAALFETSVKSNLLVLLYAPGEDIGQSAAAGVKNAATKAKLPEKYWQPVIDKVAAKVPAEEIKDVVARMQDEVSDYLATLK